MDGFGNLSGTSYEDLKHRGTCGRNPRKAGFLSKLTQCVVGYDGRCRPFVGLKGGTGSNTVLSQIQETTALHIYTLKTRVSGLLQGSSLAY